MLPDRVPNPGPLTYESGALPIALRDPAVLKDINTLKYGHSVSYWWLSVICAIRNILNFSHAVCFTSVNIFDVYWDRELLLYFKPKNTLKVSYIRVINISYPEHRYL